jgi:hypothetical protein
MDKLDSFSMMLIPPEKEKGIRNKSGNSSKNERK